MLALFLIALNLGPPAPGSRSSLAVELTGVDAPSCVTADSVRSGISETLVVSINTPTSGAPADVAMRVAIAKQTVGFSAQVELAGRHGARRQRSLTIEHDRCEELANAVILVSALLLDDLWGEEFTRAQEQPTPEPRPLIVPESAPTPVIAPWWIFAGVSGGFTYGDLPGPAAGGGLSVSFAAPRVVSFGVAANAWPRARARTRDGAGGRFSAYEGAVFVCARFVERPRLWLSTCGTGRAGATYATGLGLARAQAAVRPRVLADVTLSVRLHAGGPVWLRLAAGLGVPVVRDRFRYLDTSGGEPVLHRSWPVVPLVTAGLDLGGALWARAARSTAATRFAGGRS